MSGIVGRMKKSLFLINEMFAVSLIKECSPAARNVAAGEQIL